MSKEYTILENAWPIGWSEPRGMDVSRVGMFYNVSHARDALHDDSKKVRQL